PVADEDPDPDPDARALVEASDLATAKALLDRNFRSMYSDQGGTVWYCTDVRGFVTVVGSPDPVRADGDPRRLDTGTLRVLADTTELLDEALAELLEAPGTVLLERGRTNSQKG
ncbi:MAG: hypothetical protein FWD11_00005, partial [Micrococcales bacterium]|nr:hypothetical protein [Micrococcales bacterium]